MKKILIGCGVFFLIIIILFGILIYFVSKKMKEFERIRISLLRDYNETNNMFEFTPPLGNELNPERYEIYVMIHQNIQKVIDGKKPSFEKTRSPFKMVSKMLSALEEIGIRHSNLLYENQMSLSEYQWISINTFAVIDSQKDSEDADMKTLIQSLEKQKENLQKGADKAKDKDKDMMPDLSDDFLKDFDKEITENNIEIVKQHAKELNESIDTFILDILLLQTEELKRENIEKTLKDLEKISCVSCPQKFLDRLTLDSLSFVV